LSSVIIAGNTSGTITLDAPNVAGTTVLTLPTTSGTVLTTTGGVAPGTAGNLLTSNGTTWTSAAAPAGGVTSLNGQTGAITDTTLYAIGSYVTGRPQNTTTYSADNTIAGSSLYSASTLAVRTSGGAWQNPWSASDGVTGATLINTGTWRCLSSAPAGSNYAISGLWVRIS